MKKVIVSVCLCVLFPLNASAKKSNDYIISLHHDANETDHYSTIGVEIIHRQMNSYLGFSINSSIGYARVNDTLGYEHGFIAWEGGMKVGYFSDFSLYAEFGVDLAELTFNDRSDDDYPHNNKRYNTDFENDNLDHRDSQNDIDGYIGIGSSIMIEQIKLTGFIRFREISGHHWRAEKNTFSGIELAIVF
jgi:hypothetical protein